MLVENLSAGQLCVLQDYSKFGFRELVIDGDIIIYLGNTHSIDDSGFKYHNVWFLSKRGTWVLRMHAHVPWCVKIIKTKKIKTCQCK